MVYAVFRAFVQEGKAVGKDADVRAVDGVRDAGAERLSAVDVQDHDLIPAHRLSVMGLTLGEVKPCDGGRLIAAEFFDLSRSLPLFVHRFLTE